MHHMYQLGSFAHQMKLAGTSDTDHMCHLQLAQIGLHKHLVRILYPQSVSECKLHILDMYHQASVFDDLHTNQAHTYAYLHFIYYMKGSHDMYHQKEVFA